MPLLQQMNGLRRNEVAMKPNAGITIIPWSIISFAVYGMVSKAHYEHGQQ